MTDADQELLRQLDEDIGLLRSMVVPPPGQNVRPTPQATRAIIGPILRRWICEQLLHKVQRLLIPRAIKFPIHAMPRTVEHCRGGRIESWMSMIELSGVAISMMLPKMRDAEGFPTVDVSGDGQGAPSLLPARAFFEQKMFYWGGRFFTRAQILSAQANKRGGVHLDFSRSDDEEHVDALPIYFGIEVKGTNYQMLVGDSIRVAKADPLRRPNTYDAFELIAIDSARILVSGVDASSDDILSLQTAF